jgi:hypothetical protein
MMADKHIAYVEQGAIDAALGAAKLLSEAGDTRGALRELEHFVAALEDRVLVPLGDAIEKAAGETDDPLTTWLVSQGWLAPFTGAALENFLYTRSGRSDKT